MSEGSTPAAVPLPDTAPEVLPLDSPAAAARLAETALAHAGAAAESAAPAGPTRVVWDIEPAALAKMVGTFLAVWLAINVWPVVVLVLVSLMLVATFNPVVRRLQQRINRTWALTTVILGIIGTGTLLLVLMIPPLVRQGRNLVEHLPAYTASVQATARRYGLSLKMDDLTRDWSQRVTEFGPEMFSLFTTVLSGITGVLTVAVLTTYLLMEGPKVGTSCLRLFPREARLPARRMLEEVGEQVGQYMRGQLLTSALAGLFTYVFLLIVGVPEPLALAFLMAVADAIPMVGPLIGTVPAVLMALSLGPTTALVVLAGYVLYQQLESHVIVPRIYGSTMKLPATVILIAILIGATLMGILGALIALPVAAAVPVVLRFVGEWRDRQAEVEARTAGLLNREEVEKRG